MKRAELIAGIEAKLRSLRQCDTQATAVAWMSAAYKLMEEAAQHLKDDEQAAARIVFVPEPPKLVVVQSFSKMNKRDIAAMEARRFELQQRSISQTVVYPDVYLHPGLKPAPKAWTHADTLKLERAAKAK